MFKEYKTIKEVVGPLMLVEGVEGVKYNELVDIVNSNGEIRQGKVLEINRDKAVVQLFENSQGLQISGAKARFRVSVSCFHNRLRSIKAFRCSEFRMSTKRAVAKV